MQILNCNILEESLFDKAGVSDYPVYRIPGIVTLQSGTMVACYECRQDSDWSVIDVGLSVSEDYGKTWSKRMIPVSGMGRNAANNPTLIADGNCLHMLYCENYKRMFHIKSDDAGKNWSKPEEITDIFDSQYWSCIAVGPGHGLSHSNGKLFATVWMAFNKKNMFSHHPSLCGIICSEDKGRKWKLVHVFKENLLNASEAAIAELKDGNIIMNIRNENDAHYRAFSIGNSDGTCWSEPAFEQNLPDPICFGGMCNCRNGVLFVNCQSQTTRQNLTLYKSVDDCKTWNALQIDTNGGYADVCYNKITDSAFVLYESNDCRYIKIAEINIY